jgi:MarR family transcriptional regulator, organic hydroperoxide resistance regulator
MSSPWFEVDPERMPLGRLLSWTGQSLHRYYRRTVATHGLTSTALGVLGVLADADAVSHRELAGRVGVTPATLTPVIDALEGAGELVRERAAADRRTIRLSITPAGRERLVAAAGEVAATLRDRIPQPAPNEQQVIRDYLLAVLAAVDDEALP